MKIKTTKAEFSEVLKVKERYKKPKKPNIFWRSLIKLISIPDLKKAKFKYTTHGLEKLGKKQPCLILMNHSSFIDMEIAESIFYPRPLNIVTTLDAFISKDWLLRQIGCIKTKKFTKGLGVIRDIQYCINKLKTSVLMFPEAGYSLDGRKTVLPDSIGKLIKLLGVPVVTVTTSGAFSRQPLYNELRKRPVPVSAMVEYLLSPEDIKSKNFEQINQLINEKFDFDAFKWQQQNNVVIDDKERAVGLERILYKCPCCGQEKMLGENDTLTCKACGKVYTLTPLGKMQAVDGKTEYEQVADWVDWQRASVKQEIENGSYNLDIPIDVRIMMDAKGVFDVGEGRLIHNENGFTLKGTQQDFTYVQEDSAIYTINADFYWYQVSDVINIGDLEVQYFCFPKDKNVSVFKVRLATEELFKKAQERIKGK